MPSSPWAWELSLGLEGPTSTVKIIKADVKILDLVKYLMTLPWDILAAAGVALLILHMLVIHSPVT